MVGVAEVAMPTVRVPDVVMALPRLTKPAPAVMEVTVPELPLPTQLPEIAKHPLVILNPTLDVEVANPEMVRPLRVVVPKPPPAISNAEMEVVAVPVGAEVAK